MPYKDKAEAREASKERMKRYRDKLHPVTPPLHPVTPLLRPDVTPVLHPDPVRPYTITKQSKLVELRTLINETSQHNLPIPESKEVVPWYDPNIKRTGQLVKMWQYGKVVEVIEPELDAEGTPIEAPSSGKSFHFNEFKPTFKPYSKPEKKVKLGKGKKGGS